MRRNRIIFACILSTLAITFGLLNFKTEKTFIVSRVIDGDTIVVSMNGVNQSVRFIGVDTPELREKECFATQAKDITEAFLLGKEIKMEIDASQSEKDRYNRLIRYVFIDEMNFSDFLIKEGYGKEYTFSNKYKYSDQFKASQKEAKKNLKGMWEECRSLTR